MEEDLSLDLFCQVVEEELGKDEKTNIVNTERLDLDVVNEIFLFRLPEPSALFEFSPFGLTSVIKSWENRKDMFCSTSIDEFIKIGNETYEKFKDARYGFQYGKIYKMKLKDLFGVC